MSQKATTARKRKRGSPIHELTTHGGKPLLFQNDNTGRKRVNTSALRFVVDVIQDETGKALSSVASELMQASEKVRYFGYCVSFIFYVLSRTIILVAIQISSSHHLYRTCVRRKRQGESRFGPDLMYQRLFRKFGVRWQRSRYDVDSDSFVLLTNILNSICDCISCHVCSLFSRSIRYR